MRYWKLHNSTEAKYRHNGHFLEVRCHNGIWRKSIWRLLPTGNLNKRNTIECNEEGVEPKKN